MYPAIKIDLIFFQEIIEVAIQFYTKLELLLNNIVQNAHRTYSIKSLKQEGLYIFLLLPFL